MPSKMATAISFHAAVRATDFPKGIGHLSFSFFLSYLLESKISTSRRYFWEEFARF